MGNSDTPNIFTDYDYYANQLWIGARYLESLSLLVFFIFSGSRTRFSFGSVFVFYAFATTGILLSVFYWKIFPICFIEGQGLTPFKKTSEYIISGILMLTLFVLYYRRDQFDSYIRKLLTWSLLLTMMSELAFTFYISNYGFSNLVGHYLKIASFYLIYKAIIETGLKRPFSLLFQGLKKTEADLRITNANLIQEVAVRKQAEEQMNITLREKETLIKEIHHRIKNNMAVVSSLLALQEDRVTDFKTKEILKDSQNRLHTMSMIHETLYRSDNPASIDLQSFLPMLVESVFQSYTISQNVNLSSDIEKIRVGAKEATLIGLVVNELITNAIKFAFPHNRKGMIALKLESNTNHEVVMTISDDGIGLHDESTRHSKDGLGLKLVTSMVENQLDGSIKREDTVGTKYIVQFKIDEI
ncbi:ATP-binding protein [bacterium]|nr:ATP-binding protein [bacterium]